jgi:hypothetical protein
MMRVLRIAIFSALFAPAAMAATYRCDFDPIGSVSAMPRSLEFTFDEGNEVARVSDSVIHNNYGKFIVAKVAADNGKRLTLKWRLDNMKGPDLIRVFTTPPTMFYTFSLFKSDNTARLDVVRGFPPNIFDIAASGRCKVVKN